MEDLINAYIPEDIVSMIDLKSITPIKASFVKNEPGMKNVHSDLILRVKIKQSDKYMYILIEHQSTVDEAIIPRIVEYNNEITREHKKIHKTKKTPPILNICLYNGRKRYDGPRNIIDTSESPALSEKLKYRNYHVIDLHSIPISEILKHKQSAMGELVLKLGGSRNFSQWLQKDMNKEIWRKLTEEASYTVSSIRYMTGIDEDREKLLNLINSIDNKNKEVMATVAQQLRQEGIQEGVEQGIVRGRLEGIQQGIMRGRQEGIKNKSISIAKNMLTLGMDIGTIKAVIGLTDGEIAEIKRDL